MILVLQNFHNMGTPHTSIDAGTVWAQLRAIPDGAAKLDDVVPAIIPMILITYIYFNHIYSTLATSLTPPHPPPDNPPESDP